MEQNSFNRFPIIGLVLVLLGVALLLNQMNVIHIGGMALVWLRLLSDRCAVGIGGVINTHRSHELFCVRCAIFLAFGAALMLTHLGYWYSRDVWKAVASYWPAVLILIGGTMLL